MLRHKKPEPDPVFVPRKCGAPDKYVSKDKHEEDVRTMFDSLQAKVSELEGKINTLVETDKKVHAEVEVKPEEKKPDEQVNEVDIVEEIKDPEK
jgi:hypothetical protein